MTYIPRSVRVPVEVDPGLADLSTRFLWHCEGTNGQQSGVDSSLYHLPISFPATSGAQITTGDFKFGTSCLALDGGADQAAYADNSSRAVAFGTGEFTVECWFKLSAADYGPEPIWANRVVSNLGMTMLHTGGATPDIRCHYSKNSTLSAFTYISLPGGTTITRNVWNHIAFCRDGYFLLIYLNFVLVNTQTLGLTDVLDVNDGWWIGGDPYTPYTSGVGWTAPRTFHGVLDEFRITCGKNMYPAGPYASGSPSAVTYLIPTQAYANPVLPVSSAVGAMKTDGVNGMYVQQQGTGLWTRIEDVDVDPRYARKPTV